MTDVVIIGKGPAGISAAVYLVRAGLEVTVIGKDEGTLKKAHLIENYYGFIEPIEGPELLRRGVEQAKRLGVTVLEEEVVGIEKLTNFSVKTNKQEIEARVVILATGKSRNDLKVDGFQKLKGSGISFCATCDGFFYRGKPLAVVGNGDYAAEELSVLTNIASEVTLFTNGLPLKTEHIPENVEVVTEKLTKIFGESTVEGIETESEKKYFVSGIFVAQGTASAADFALKMGVMIDKGNIIVNEDYMTNIDGLYAVGDCIGGLLQVAKAVSDGAQVSAPIIKKIKAAKKEEAGATK